VRLGTTVGTAGFVEIAHAIAAVLTVGVVIVRVSIFIVVIPVTAVLVGAAVGTARLIVGADAITARGAVVDVVGIGPAILVVVCTICTVCLNATVRIAGFT
jgi:hypothetical protein